MFVHHMAKLILPVVEKNGHKNGEVYGGGGEGGESEKELVYSRALPHTAALVICYLCFWVS